MRIRRALVAAVLLAAGLVAGGATTASAAAPYCGITWGSGAKTAGTLSGAPLIEVRAGQQDCWDRVVFEFDGSVTGYSVAYGETYTDGAGEPMSPYTAGGALLSVSLRAPAYDGSHGATVPYRVGDHAVNAFGYRTLRDVVFGGSFEGYTTFAVGVRAQLPFRVFVLAGPGTHSRIVLDVAHQWQA
ncbi:hypothetical protein K7640_20435 [Micromonospora sp. PLK6-60]|uniref:AMIN-like domain-containing (lipo)protein n=1 Tax=Micromonospora sp. PLK6-60 TaxID=2873383 RepID=UPI001CA5F649|nr:hypothetical protein [Micromonospora sp. PLK6-60]MBY8874200.1 hypothetical protein [Micromonospora sp. PLK6-60]